MAEEPDSWAPVFLVGFFRMRSLFSLVGFCVLAYAFFFIPLGSRTAFQHCQRIADTDEAQELEREAGEAAGRLREDVRRRMGELIDAGPPDSSASPVLEHDKSELRERAKLP